ncbi:M13 family metallopeptidase [Demequina activiva]|uniref:Peptidase M13 n=1 Tax=Demequina activiva TaxID=1582364 RepID=A0A919Q179_9MICO|nr:M13-type metalloendopeptidase [Demequina activiva]GIG53402.1 peptidase M13 [Demequina activiva]
MASHSGIDRSEFSPTVRPGDDFFRYVSGPWEESHVIPDDRAADGSFYTLRDEAEKHTRAIIEAADPDSQIGALYRSFMDVDRVDALGTQPLAEDLDLIASAQDHSALAAAMGALQRTGVSGTVGYYVFADKNNPDANVVYLAQYGLGLPDEAYYREESHADTRAKYVEHVDRMAALTGVPFSGASILALETALAQHHWDVVKTREAELTHNPTTLARLAADAPGFDWRTWADAIHLPEAAEDLLIAGEPSYFEAFSALWPQTSVEDWQEYLRWRVVNSRAPYLTEEISKANFSFYGTVLSGAVEQRDRWKRGVGFVESVAGELVGQEYVKEHFPPDYKEQMDRLVANLIEAYRVSIDALPWMTPATRQRALDKLAQFTPKIGYPEKWRDYSGLEVSAEDLVGNVRAASAFEEDWEWSKIGRPVDRTEWLMTPQTVNAYYLPMANEIVFPAAILQPPFFHPEADNAVNYGGIGSVIGHEIGHGFDDQGSKYNGTGALEDWWTEEDRAAFMERANALIAQYDGYSPRQLDGSHHVNGALTVGENIGDLAGVEIALKAYEIALGHPIAEAPEVDGLTATQRFFIGYALTERMKTRSEALITRLSTDPHSPSEFRVNGIVRNMDAWYDAFEVTEGDELWLAPQERVSIW